MVIVDHAIRLGGIVVKQAPVKAPDSAPMVFEMTPVPMGLEADPAFQKLTARDRAIHEWAAPGAQALQTDEVVEGYFRESDELRDDLGAMPLVVVSTALSAPDYLALQRRLLSYSSNSKQIIAGKSGHGVILDEPEVVVRAIRSVVDSARR